MHKSIQCILAGDCCHPVRVVSTHNNCTRLSIQYFCASWIPRNMSIAIYVCMCVCGLCCNFPKFCIATIQSMSVYQRKATKKTDLALSSVSIQPIFRTNKIVMHNFPMEILMVAGQTKRTETKKRRRKQLLKYQNAYVCFHWIRRIRRMDDYARGIGTYTDRPTTTTTATTTTMGQKQHSECAIHKYVSYDAFCSRSSTCLFLKRHKCFEKATVRLHYFICHFDWIELVDDFNEHIEFHCNGEANSRE